MKRQLLNLSLTLFSILLTIASCLLLNTLQTTSCLIFFMVTSFLFLMSFIHTIKVICIHFLSKDNPITKHHKVSIKA